MTHLRWISLGRGALQLATLFLATAPVTFGGEPPASRDDQLIGHVVVTAAREPQLIGNLVVTASRIAPTGVAIAHLGSMTVTARRDTALARNDSPQPVRASF